jgi:hypothetical protein
MCTDFILTFDIIPILENNWAPKHPPSSGYFSWYLYWHFGWCAIFSFNSKIFLAFSWTMNCGLTTSRFLVRGTFNAFHLCHFLDACWSTRLKFCQWTMNLWGGRGDYVCPCSVQQVYDIFQLHDTRRAYLQIWPQRTSTHQGIMKDGW